VNFSPLTSEITHG